MNIFDNIDELRIKICELALQQYHKKYERTRRGPDSFDCAGLTWYVYYSLFGIDINYGGIGMSTTTKQMTSNIGKLLLFEEKSEDKKYCLNYINLGDILFFHRQALEDYSPKINNKYPGHCGIYLGSNNFIHASCPRNQVIISDFEKNQYWLDVLVGSKDVVIECQNVKVIKNE